MTTERDPALDTSGRRLDQFLTKAIRELKPMDEFVPTHPEPAQVAKPTAKPMVNKFTELAKKLKANRETMSAEADALSAEADAIMPTFHEAVGKHRSLLSDAKSGIKDMADAANILSNFDPNE